MAASEHGAAVARVRGKLGPGCQRVATHGTSDDEQYGCRTNMTAVLELCGACALQCTAALGSTELRSCLPACWSAWSGSPRLTVAAGMAASERPLLVTMWSTTAASSVSRARAHHDGREQRGMIDQPEPACAREQYRFVKVQETKTATAAVAARCETMDRGVVQQYEPGQCQAIDDA